MSNVFALFTRQDRWSLFVLLLMTLVGTLFEVLGIGLVLPFIGLLSSPEWIHANSAAQYVYDLLSVASDKQFIIVLGLSIILLFILKSVFYILFARYQAAFYLWKQHELQTRLFNAYISAPFAFHSSHNSAQLIRNINTEAGSVCNGILLPIITLVSEGVVVFALLVLLAYMSPVIVGGALLLALLLFCAYPLVAPSIGRLWGAQGLFWWPNV